MASSSRKRFIYNAGKSKKPDNKSSLQFATDSKPELVSNAESSRNSYGSVSHKKETKSLNSNSLTSEELAISNGKEAKRQKTDISIVDLCEDIDDEFDFADDIQDDFSLVELDRIEQEASQIPSKSNLSSLSSKKNIETSSNILTSIKTNNETKNSQFVFRKPSISTSPNNRRIHSSCSSDASPLKETLTLFSGTFNEQYDDDDKHLLPIVTPAIDRSKLEESKVNQLTEKLVSKDGEIKMLRDSLARLQSSDIQSKNTIRKLNDEIKENESKKNAALKAQVEKLETQLKFKGKEVADAIHKQHVISETLQKRLNNQSEIRSKPNSVKSSPGDGFQASPSRKVIKSIKNQESPIITTSNHTILIHANIYQVNKFEVIANQISAKYSFKEDLLSEMPCVLSNLQLTKVDDGNTLESNNNEPLTNIISRTCICNMSILKDILKALRDKYLQHYERSFHVVLKLCKTALLEFWQNTFIDKLASIGNSHCILVALNAVNFILKMDYGSRLLLINEMIPEDELNNHDDINDDILLVISTLRRTYLNVDCPSYLEILCTIIHQAEFRPLVEAAFSCCVQVSNAKRPPRTLFEFFVKENICISALKSLGALAVDGVLSILMSSIENGNTLELLCNRKGSCPFLETLNILLTDSSIFGGIETVCDMKLKIVCILSSIIAKNNGNYSILFNRDCECSNEVLRSVVLLLHEEYQEYEKLLVNGDQLNNDNDRFYLLRQGTSLLAQLCLNDNRLMEHRNGVVQEYTILIHGVVKTLQQKPDISEHEILLLQDLMSIDQYDDMDDANQQASQMTTELL